MQKPSVSIPNLRRAFAVLVFGLVALAITGCDRSTSSVAATETAITSAYSWKAAINLFAGWFGFLLGALSGALIGLRFHRPEWLGGYDAFPRRMVRLGHIAFFGIGLINILFALSVGSVSSATVSIGGICLVIALATMSTNCFLTAWRPGFRHLFFIPAGTATGGIVALLIHLSGSLPA